MGTYIQFPNSRTHPNPFLRHFSDSLAEEGWVEAKCNFRFREIIRHGRQVSVYHFHWPEAIWRDSSLVRCTLRCLAFIARVGLVKLLRVRISWSVHNLLPHACRQPFVEKFMRLFLRISSDVLIAHAKNVYDELGKSTLARNKRVLAYHGLFESGARTELSSRIRQALGGHNSAVFVGWVSFDAYKNHTLLFAAWRMLLAPQAKLIVLGPRNSVRELPPNSFHALALLSTMVASDAIAENVPELRSIDYLTNEMLAAVLHAADYVVLPYADISTSGALFLAASYRKPVVCPRQEFFVAHTSDREALYYSSGVGDVDSLREALQRAIKESPRKEAWRDAKGKFNWKQTAVTIAHAWKGSDA